MFTFLESYTDAKAHDFMSDPAIVEHYKVYLEFQKVAQPAEHIVILSAPSPTELLVQGVQQVVGVSTVALEPRVILSAPHRTEVLEQGLQAFGPRFFSHSFTFFPAVRYLCFSSIVPCRIRSVPRNKGVRHGNQFAGGHRVSGEYEQHRLVKPLPPINRCSRRGHGSGRSPPPLPSLRTQFTNSETRMGPS
jgi:hypothetical protein